MADLTPPNTGSEALNEYLTRLQQVVKALDLKKIPEEGWSLTDLRADVSEVISDKRDIIDVANEAASKLAEVKALVMDLDGYEQSLEGAEAFKVAAESLIDWYDQNEVSIRILLGMVNKPGGAAELIEAFDAIRIEAAQSASAAKTSETNAKASETAAASSKNAAATSASNAKTSETNAKASETNAKTSETNAKASETAANSSKNAAATSASNAKTSETNAKTSETAAASSATAAANSATAAENSANSITDGAEVATFKAAEAAAAADRAEAATAGKADLIGGKVPTSQIPEVALTKPFSVTSRAGMLALTAQEGDIAIITTGADKGTYILGTGAPNVFASWLPMAVSSDVPVQSVNGQVGTVVLSATDVGAAPTSHTHTSAQISDATSAATPNTVVKRGATGDIAVNTPTYNAHPANKEYVDTQVATRAPTTHTHTSAQISDATSAATANRVVKRDSTGAIAVNTPTATSHPTPKSYVDAQVATRAPTTHTHTVAQITNLPGISKFGLADGLVQRSSDGAIYVGTAPTDGNYAVPKKYVDSRPALFSGAGNPPSTIPGAVVGDYWLNETTMQLLKITGV